VDKNQQHQEGNIKQFSTIKKNINVFKSVKDLKMLMHSTIELGEVDPCTTPPPPSSFFLAAPPDSAAGDTD
jgi:hypothetical protein